MNSMKCSVTFGFNPTHCTAVFGKYNSIFAHYLGLVLGLGLGPLASASALASRCLAIPSIIGAGTFVQQPRLPVLIARLIANKEAGECFSYSAFVKYEYR